MRTRPALHEDEDEAETENFGLELNIPVCIRELPSVEACLINETLEPSRSDKTVHVR